MVLMTPEQIREMRVSLGMTQKNLADAMGVTDSTISYWEKGFAHPVYHTMRRLNELAEQRRYTLESRVGA